MGKITETFLRSQVNRLKILPRGEDRPWGTDKEPGLREEIYRELWRQAESNEDAQRIIDRVIDTCKFCPSPAELIEIATNMRLERAQEQEWKNPHDNPTDLCKRCEPWGAYGWILRDGRCERCPMPHGAEVTELIELINEQLSKSKVLSHR